MPAANASTEAHQVDRTEARTRSRLEDSNGVTARRRPPARAGGRRRAGVQGRLSLAVPWMSVVVVDLD